MIKRFKKVSRSLGLFFTIASGIFTMVLSDTFFFSSPRLEPFHYDPVLML